MLFSRSRSYVPLVGPTVDRLENSSWFRARTWSSTLSARPISPLSRTEKISRGSAGVSDKDFSRLPAPEMASLLFSARPCGDRQAGQDRI